MWMLGKECRYCNEVIQVEWEDGDYQGDEFIIVNELLQDHIVENH